METVKIDFLICNLKNVKTIVYLTKILIWHTYFTFYNTPIWLQVLYRKYLSLVLPVVHHIGRLHISFFYLVKKPTKERLMPIMFQIQKCNNLEYHLQPSPLIAFLSKYFFIDIYYNKQKWRRSWVPLFVACAIYKCAVQKFLSSWISNTCCS